MKALHVCWECTIYNLQITRLINSASCYIFLLFAEKDLQLSCVDCLCHVVVDHHNVSFQRLKYQPRVKETLFSKKTAACSNKDQNVMGM